jgi:hypothetical protein
MKNGILCATDFTEASRGALKWSIQLAKELKTHLTILYTYRILKQNGEVLSMKKRMDEEGLKNFKALEKEWLDGSGVSYDFKTEIGFVDDRIEEHARKNRISLLVLDKSMTVKNKEAFNDLVENLQAPLVIVP